MEGCHIELARQDMAPVAESEMFEGIPDTGARGIRIRHASCEFRDVTGNTCLEAGAEAFIFEDGARTDTL
jgi:hypothetical protein